jgi:hypothetical protein
MASYCLSINDRTDEELGNIVAASETLFFHTTNWVHDALFASTVARPDELDPRAQMCKPFVTIISNSSPLTTFWLTICRISFYLLPPRWKPLPSLLSYIPFLLSTCLALPLCYDIGTIPACLPAYRSDICFNAPGPFMDALFQPIKMPIFHLLFQSTMSHSTVARIPNFSAHFIPSRAYQHARSISNWMLFVMLSIILLANHQIRFAVPSVPSGSFRCFPYPVDSISRAFC